MTTTSVKRTDRRISARVEITAAGVDVYGSIVPAPVPLPEALDRAGEFLADAAERALRMVLVGTRLAA
jgi:glycerate kinase